MQLKDNQILFQNVEVLWPRIDMPYKKNNATGNWDKCTSLVDEDGKYEIIIKFQPEQAQQLYAKMLEIFNAQFAGKTWLQKVRDPVTGADSDVVVGSSESCKSKLIKTHKLNPEFLTSISTRLALQSASPILK